MPPALAVEYAITWAVPGEIPYRCQAGRLSQPAIRAETGCAFHGIVRSPAAEFCVVATKPPRWAVIQSGEQSTVCGGRARSYRMRV